MPRDRLRSNRFNPLKQHPRWIGALVCFWSVAPAPMAFAELGPAMSWTEAFVDDPTAAGRFSVPVGHDPLRFNYDSGNRHVTAHFDSIEPTAWYMRPLDVVGGRTLGRYDDFDLRVTFTIRSAGFFADPNQFAQIGWALLNSQTTGEDRAGGSAGPYAFDVVGFDYFPNVSPLFGGPTLSPTIIHSDLGQDFFFSFEFPPGRETAIDAPLGDVAPELDSTYVGQLHYRAAVQTLTMTLERDGVWQPINADGAGGPGGFDGDPTTIQTQVQIDLPFTVDVFALTAWQDTFNPFSSSVIADVDISRIEFSAPASRMGDLNLDGSVNGLDVAAFVRMVLSGEDDAELIARGDFHADGALTADDVPGLIDAILADQ